jgi:hypothetical protein
VEVKVGSGEGDKKGVAPDQAVSWGGEEIGSQLLWGAELSSHIRMMGDQQE